MAQKQPENSKRGKADHLAPFRYKPGQSGNAGGRPKGRTVTPALRDLLDKADTSDKLAEVLIKVGLGKLRTSVRNRVDTIEKIIKATDGQRVVLDAGEGFAELANLDPVDLALARSAMLRKLHPDDDEPERPARRGRSRKG